MNVIDLRPYQVASLRLPYFIKMVNEYQGTIRARTVSEEDCEFVFTLTFPEPTKVINFDGTELHGAAGHQMDLTYMLHMRYLGPMEPKLMERFA